MVRRRSVPLKRFLVAALLSTATPAFVFASPAGAQTTPPLVVDATVDGQFAQPDPWSLSAGAADNGDAVAAWRDGSDAVSAIKLALWRAGTATPQVTVPGLGRSPSIAMAPNGRAVAAWTGSDGRPRVARREPGGAFLTPKVVETPLFVGYPSLWGDPSVAIRADGSAVMAVATCIDFGMSSELASRAIDISPTGELSAPVDTKTWVTGSGCFALGKARVAVGAGASAVVTHCVAAYQYCKASTRPVGGGAWTSRGVDGTEFAPGTDEAAPAIAPSGSSFVVWQAPSPGPTAVLASVGTGAAAPTQLGIGSGAGVQTSGFDVAAFGTDGLAVWQQATSGGRQVVARPIFANGTYGASTVIAPLTRQSAAPYADPHVASWPDGTSVIAYAEQAAPTGAATLSLRRRSIGGLLSPITSTALPSSAVSHVRLALAGDGSAPLGLVATHEVPPAPAKASVVLRRIDGLPPTVTIGGPDSAVAGAPVAFSSTVADVSTPVSVAWDFGDGTAGQGGAVEHTYASAGSRTVTATATDAAGNVRTATATVKVSAPGAGGAGAAGNPTPLASPGVAGPVDPAPVITEAKLTAARFRVGSATTALAAAAPRVRPKGSTLKLTLSEAAKLEIAVVRRERGRTVKGRCTVGAKKGKACTRRQTRATLTRALGAGAASIPFSARLASGRLAAGTYELVLVATDPAGQRSAPITLPFTVVR